MKNSRFKVLLYRFHRWFLNKLYPTGFALRDPIICPHCYSTDHSGKFGELIFQCMDCKKQYEYRDENEGADDNEWQIYVEV